MKTGPAVSLKEAFTVIEVLLVAAVLLIMFLLLLPMRSGPHPPPFSSRCLNNLKQIDLAMQMFASDNNGLFPAEVLATNAVSAELLDAQSPASCFAPLIPYVKPFNVWICPADKRKVPAPTGAQFSNSNVSYFLSLNATGIVAEVILAGDRHLTANGEPLAPGIFAATTNSIMGWSPELHALGKRTRGCLAFGDGHAEFVTSNLGRRFRAQPFGVSRLAIP